VGAASAVAVFLVLRRFGQVAAVTGGLLYAVWPPAINGETSTFLECVPSLLLLLALFVLGSERLAARPAYQLAAGAALGLAMSIKIWGLVPLLVVVVWQLAAAGWRRALMILAGAAGATVLVCGPTFVLAPARMWEFVVADQFARSGANTSLLLRLESITPVDRLWPSASSAQGLVAVVLVGVITAMAALLAVRVPAARVFVALLVAQCLVICASPPFFTHYTAFTGPAAALTAGVASQRLVDRLTARAPRLRRPALAVLAVAVVVIATPSFTHAIYTPFDGAHVGSLVAGRRCVAADSPAVLILAGVLTRDLDRHCPTRIDVSGATYNVDAVVGANGRMVPRARNRLWQDDLIAYLTSAQAAIVARPSSDGFDRASRSRLGRLTLLYRAHSVSVYGH
jgi:alpha-1,2-mannosyltransferase